MRLHVRCILAVCGLCLSLLLLNGCETVKGAVKGGAEGISKDWGDIL